jgi:hypothetical protein
VITYCFDHTLSPKLAFSMRNLLPELDDEPLVVPHDIVHVRELEGVEPGAPLDLVISKVAACDHTLVTCVTASKRKQINVALSAARLKVVYLADRFADLSDLSRAARLLDCWERIVKGSYRLGPGQAVAVTLNGVVSHVA